MKSATKKMTIDQMKRRIEELEAQNSRLVAKFRTGRLSYWGKTYRGIQLDAEVERQAIEHCRERLADQFDGDVNPKNDAGVSVGNLTVIDDGRSPVVAGIELYICSYSYDDQNGTYLEKLYQAIEIND